MKKIVLLLALINFVFASAVSNGTNIKSIDYPAFYGKKSLSFKFLDTTGICINETVYYMEGNDHVHDSRSRIMSISHNPITNRPYYCKINSFVKAKKQDWATSGTIYEQNVIIYHNYSDIK